MIKFITCPMCKQKGKEKHPKYDMCRTCANEIYSPKRHIPTSTGSNNKETRILGTQRLKEVFEKNGISLNRIPGKREIYNLYFKEKTYKVKINIISHNKQNINLGGNYNKLDAEYLIVYLNSKDNIYIVPEEEITKHLDEKVDRRGEDQTWINHDFFIKAKYKYNMDGVQSDLMQFGVKHKHIVTSEKFDRNPVVVNNALKHNKDYGNICDCCKCSPYPTKSGKSSFQVAHIIPLKDGGADSVDNTAVLCCICHGKLDKGSNQDNILKTIKANQKDKYNECV